MTALQDDRIDFYRRVAAAAALAPSAENTQPWQFVVREDALIVLLDTTRTLASDIDNMLSLTAIGACIENAVVAATSLGSSSSVTHLIEPASAASKSALLPIARIQFSDVVGNGAPPELLADCIEPRHTCRRMHARPVEELRLDELQESCRAFPGVRVHWVDQERLGEIAKLIGIGNQIRFEYEPFHEELYRSLRFTAAEAESTRDGLDVATLQLPAGLAKVLSVLRTWPRMKWANLLGFSKTVAKQTGQEVRGSGAVGFLTVPAPETLQYVDGGRALERIWLTATRSGLGLHPTASLPVFLAYARTGGQGLLPRHQRLSAEMAEQFRRLYPDVAGRTVQMAFRIGYPSTPPAARALRRNLEDVLRFE